MKLLLAFIICLLLVPGVGADLKIANDPAQVGVGARSLGMGGVILNFSDVSSLLGNPAALSVIDDPQYTFMHGKFINEVDYISIGGAIPIPWGVLGVAYLNSQLSYTGPLSTIEVVDGIRILPSTTEVGTDLYRNSAIYFTFGKKASELIDVEYLEKLHVGATFKIFSQELKGAGIAGSGSGYEMDMGLQYEIFPWMNFSLLGKNVLPASMGGKLVWQPGGREESYPFFIKTGLLAEFAGEVPFLDFEDQSLAVAIEYDMHPRKNAPDLLHYGLEWGLGEILAIRLGRDQGYIGRGGTSTFDTADNLTYGVGVTYQGWRFDYAFHEYYDDSDLNTSYFSITYGVPFKKVKVVKEKGRFSPPDKYITSEPSIMISGKNLPADILYVVIKKGQYLEVINRAFSAKYNLGLGRNKIEIMGIDIHRQEKIIGRRHILRLVGFKDVGPDYWAKRPIEALATLGMIKGYPGDLFKPDKKITRAEFATLLARLSGREKYEAKEKLAFTDLPGNHWAYSAVAYAVANNLMKGYPDDTFKPNKEISRAEGVVVVARFAGLNLDSPVYEIPFEDVPGRHWATKGIYAAKNAGLLEYLEEKFQPNTALTRAEVAEILSRVSFIKKEVNKLLKF
jgi:hypothetical protein